MKRETYGEFLDRLNCGQTSFESLAKTIWIERFENSKKIADLELENALKEELIINIKNSLSLREVMELIEDFKN